MKSLKKEPMYIKQILIAHTKKGTRAFLFFLIFFIVSLKNKTIFHHVTEWIAEVVILSILQVSNVTVYQSVFLRW